MSSNSSREAFAAIALLPPQYFLVARHLLQNAHNAGPLASRAGRGIMAATFAEQMQVNTTEAIQEAYYVKPF
jgi:hypothetical protein